MPSYYFYKPIILLQHTTPVAAATMGYWSMGNTTVRTSTTNGLTFATDTTTMVTKGASTVSALNAAASSSTTLGYWAGGNTGAGTPRQTTVTSGLTFATDTNAMVTKGALVVQRDRHSATQSSTNGYYSGGDTNNGNDFVTSTDGLNFSSDTSAMVTKGILTTQLRFADGCESTTVGYTAGGNTSITTNQGLTFATDTSNMTTRGALTVASTTFAGASPSTTIGYWAGGSSDNGTTAMTTTQGLTFSSDTTTMVTKGALSAVKMNSIGGGSSGTLAYFAGGHTGDGISLARTDGLTFATDTTTMVTKGALSAATLGIAGTQNSSI